jgi:hypothetical protein
LLGILNPRVNILLVTVGWRTGRRIPQLPKAVNEFIPILICRQIEKDILVLIRNEVVDFISKPCPVTGIEIFDRVPRLQDRRNKEREKYDEK